MKALLKIILIEQRKIGLPGRLRGGRVQPGYQMPLRISVLVL